MAEERINTSFYGVFKSKLQKQKEDMKKELERAKSDRRREWLRRQLKEAKSMRDLLKQMEKQMGHQTNCPHCGGEL